MLIIITRPVDITSYIIYFIHFIPTSFKKSTKEETLKSFEYIQKHDQIKNNYCKDKGMNLLRIRYDENVEEKLMNYFENLY